MNEWEWKLLEDKEPIGTISVSGVTLKKDDRVRLRPRQGGDVFDLALAGRIAIIESIEQDYEGNLHLAVIVEDDPGRDMGVLRQPGHRFFFKPEEVEPVPHPKILVAGIGNIFMGDDAFGVEVIRRLAGRKFPENVRITDFGMRGYDLTYALLDGYDPVIFIDASPRGGAPGTVYLIEPVLNGRGQEVPGLVAPDAHGMDLMVVIRTAMAMGWEPKRVLLIGCEPVELGGEEGSLGLSEEVERGVDEAITLLESLIAKILSWDMAFPIT